MSKKVPKLRFKGFDEEWEDKKLGDIGYTKSGIGFPESEQGGKEGVPFYKVSDMNTYGNEIEMLYSNNYVSDEQITRKKWKPIIEIPALIFAKVGAAIMLNRKRLITHPFFIDNNTMAYIFEEDWDINFGKITFDTINLPKYAQIGALPSYNSSDIETITISIPNIKEQEKIGMFFKNLDNLISLRERRLNLLKEQKKGFLQKLFPKVGEVAPELRFNGFDENWVVRKLGDVVEVKSGKDYKHLNPGEIPVYGTGGYMLSVDQALSYDEDAIGIGRKGTIDKPYLLEAPFWTVDTLFYSLPIKHNDINFVFTLFQNINWKTYDESTGVPSLSKTAINKIATCVPKVEEQLKIGLLFNHFDESITFHKRVLDLLKEQKKGLLQNMFI